MADLPPTPLHILRSHSSPITTLHISSDNERIYTADTLGRVVVTSTRTLRGITAWDAHADSVLGVEEREGVIFTQGRDNKLHAWCRIVEMPAEKRIGGSAALPGMQTPVLRYSMEVNALNFCRFSLLAIQGEGEKEEDSTSTFIALPNLVDSSTADIWALPSKTRIHAAIGQEVKKPLSAMDPGGRNTSGIIMSLHLYRYNRPSEEQDDSPKTKGRLRLLTAYENGSVVLREYSNDAAPTSIEGAGWDVLWKARLHVESIMAMRVSISQDFAVTVSADHIVGRYDLSDDIPDSAEHGVIFRTKHAGNGSVALRDDGRVCAVGGWDGKIRLYSTKTFKPLGTLKHHKTACQCVEFARQKPISSRTATSGDDNHATAAVDDDDSNGQDVCPDEDDNEDDEEMSAQEREERTRWLVSGSKDTRVAIWPLASFDK